MTVNKRMLSEFVKSKKLKVVQDLHEFCIWLNLVNHLEPRVGMEIGTCKGGTALLTAKFIKGLEFFITVDIEDRPVNHRKVLCLRGDTRLLSTRKKVVDTLEGKPLDFLFIDGEHDLLTVAVDFYSFAPLVRKGGLVGIHDIHTFAEGKRFCADGTLYFWRTLRKLEPHKLEDIKKSVMGIGIYHC